MNSTMRLARWFGILVAVALGTATFSGPAAAAANSHRPESCRLLRASEITRTFAQPTAGATRGHAPLACDWTLGATDTRPAGMISVYLKRGDSATGDFDLARDFTGNTRIKLPGLGRQAFYSPGYTTVYVLRDPGTILFVQGLYPDGAVDASGLQSALVALAGKATHRA
jgi:hypothetical protein